MSYCTRDNRALLDEEMLQSGAWVFSFSLDHHLISSGATSPSPKVDLLLRFSQISQDGAIIHIQAIFVCSHYQAHTPQANLCDQTDGVLYTRTKQATSASSHNLNMPAPTSYSNISNQSSTIAKNTEAFQSQHLARKAMEIKTIYVHYNTNVN